MRIRKFALREHPVLKNACLDFSQDSFSNSVCLIVGENGCGKTKFLNELSRLFEQSFNPNPALGYGYTVEFEISAEDREKLGIASGDILRVMAHPESPSSSWIDVSFEVDDRPIGIVDQKSRIARVFKEELSSFLYTTPETTYNLSNIQSVTATDLFAGETPKNKQTGNIATEIAQLLIDIQSQDDSVAGEWIRANPGFTGTIPELPSKLERFKFAFKTMFENKELVGVRVQSNQHKVVFRDCLSGAEFDLSSLSTGEQQIVYRAGYLLKNMGKMASGIVLIDEPEVSLHPKWISKYIQFLRRVLASDSNDIQVFMISHSPILIRSALQEGAHVFCFKRDALGVLSINSIYGTSFGVLASKPSWGEVVHFAFDLTTEEFHNSLFAEIQSKHSLRSITAVNNWLEDKGFQKSFTGRDQNGRPVAETLMVYVRNSIHHPEETARTYTPEQLSSSVNDMIKILSAP